MTTTHRNFDGSWSECFAPEACVLKFHFPDMTPDEAAQMPERLLWDLLEIMDPPNATDLSGTKMWYHPDIARITLHRDYDLPALVDVRGGAAFYQLGQKHRAGGKPAVFWVGPRARREWYVHDKRKKIEVTVNGKTYTSTSPNARQHNAETWPQS